MREQPGAPGVPFRELFELSPDATLLFVQGVVVHANHAAAGLFGARSVVDLIGRQSTDLLHPDCVPEVERRVVAFLEERVTSARAEEKYLRFDRSEVRVQTTVARATFCAGKAFIVSLRDVDTVAAASAAHGHGEPPAKRLEELVEDLAARHGLAPAQRRIVCAAVESSSHDVICARVDISNNTLKTQIHRILQRTRAGSLEELVAPLRAAALRR